MEDEKIIELYFERSENAIVQTEKNTASIRLLRVMRMKEQDL